MAVRKAKRKAVKKAVKKKVKRVKKFTATELKAAAKQLGAKGGRATARRAKAKRTSKRNKWMG